MIYIMLIYTVTEIQHHVREVSEENPRTNTTTGLVKWWIFQGGLKYLSGDRKKIFELSPRESLKLKSNPGLKFSTQLLQKQKMHIFRGNYQ